MLVKNPEERLTVGEIKEHPWFKQFSIVKLEVQPKPVDIRKVESEAPQGYQVIAKPSNSTVRESDLSQASDSKVNISQVSKLGEEDMQYSASSSDEDTKSDIFEELTTKENLEKLKSLIAAQNEEKYTHKTNISVKELEINSRLARMKDLQTAIEEKKVYKSYLLKNIEKHTAQLAEKCSEIDKLQLISTPEKLDTLATAARNELATKTAEFNLLSKGLEQLRDQGEQLCAEVTLKERVMNELSSKLQKLHQDFKISRVSLASNVSEVKLTYALMQSRMRSGPRKSVLESDDLQRADELIDLIRTRMNEIEGENQGISYLKKLIDAQENAIFSKEEDINTLTATYDRKKLDLRQELQVKIREVKQMQREQQIKVEQVLKEKKEKQRKELNEALQRARETDKRSFFSEQDYSLIKSMHLVTSTQNLVTKHQSFRQNIDKMQRDRSELAAKLSQMQIQENELKAHRRR